MRTWWAMVGRLRVWLPLAVTGVAACGGHDSSSQGAAGPNSDAVTADAPHLTTSVRGVLEGVPFELRYSAVKRGVPGNPLIWVCAANVPVTYVECEQTGMPSRIMFLGPFIYDANNNPKWGLAFQTGLYRVGSNALTEYA